MATDQFGSHVLQSLLCCLHESLQLDADSKKAQSLRSNKSRHWKTKQAPMSSLFQTVEDSPPRSSLIVPSSFNDAAAKIVHALKGQMSGNEIRLLAGNPMSSPLLQVYYFYRSSGLFN